MSLTTLDGLVSAMTASTAQRWRTFGVPVLGSADRWYDTFLCSPTGLYYGTGSLPGSLGGSALCDRTTAGALPFTNPAGGATEYLAHLSGWCSVGGSIALYDRLWHATVDTSINTLQTLSGATMTRPDANGTDVEMWLEADPTSSPGSIGTNGITVTYTNQAGTGSRTARCGSTAADMGLPNNLFGLSAASMWPFRLQAGDYGVQSVQSCQWTTAMLAGHCGLVLLRRIGLVPISNNFTAGMRDMFQLALSRVDSGACLSVMQSGAAPSTPNMSLQYGLVEG